MKRLFMLYEKIENETEPKETGLYRFLLRGFYRDEDIKDYQGEGRILKALNTKTGLFEVVTI